VSNVSLDVLPVQPVESVKLANWVIIFLEETLVPDALNIVLSVILQFIALLASQGSILTQLLILAKIALLVKDV
jgi:hypothetical protein